MIPRATAIGVGAGAATAVATAYFSGLARCIDTPAFYYTPALIWASLGVAAIAFAAALTSMPAGWRIAIPTTLIGVVLIVTALVGPPYRTCGQFFAPL